MHLQATLQPASLVCSLPLLTGRRLTASGRARWTAQHWEGGRDGRAWTAPASLRKWSRPSFGRSSLRAYSRHKVSASCVRSVALKVTQPEDVLTRRTPKATCWRLSPEVRKLTASTIRSCGSVPSSPAPLRRHRSVLDCTGVCAASHTCACHRAYLPARARTRWRSPCDIWVGFLSGTRMRRSSLGSAAWYGTPNAPSSGWIPKVPATASATPTRCLRSSNIHSCRLFPRVQVSGAQRDLHL